METAWYREVMNKMSNAQIEHLSSGVISASKVFSMTERKLATSSFVLLYCGLMIIVFGIWLLIFQNSADLEQFGEAGLLGDVLLIVGILTCIVSGILIQRESD